MNIYVSEGKGGKENNPINGFDDQIFYFAEFAFLYLFHVISRNKKFYGSIINKCNTHPTRF